MNIVKRVVPLVMVLLMLCSCAPASESDPGAADSDVAKNENKQASNQNSNGADLSNEAVNASTENDFAPSTISFKPFSYTEDGTVITGDEEFWVPPAVRAVVGDRTPRIYGCVMDWTNEDIKMDVDEDGIVPEKVIYSSANKNTIVTCDWESGLDDVSVSGTFYPYKESVGFFYDEPPDFCQTYYVFPSEWISGIKLLFWKEMGEKTFITFLTGEGENVLYSEETRDGTMVNCYISAPDTWTNGANVGLIGRPDSIAHLYRASENNDKEGYFFFDFTKKTEKGSNIAIISNGSGSATIYVKEMATGEGKDIYMPLEEKGWSIKVAELADRDFSKFEIYMISKETGERYELGHSMELPPFTDWELFGQSIEGVKFH